MSNTVPPGFPLTPDGHTRAAVILAVGTENGGSVHTPRRKIAEAAAIVAKEKLANERTTMEDIKRGVRGPGRVRLGLAYKSQTTLQMYLVFACLSLVN